jgi:hypothetical protein
MSVLNLQIANVLDDGFEYDASFFNTDYEVVNAGSAFASWGANGDENGFLRFTGVSGLQGASIASAILTLRCYETHAGVTLKVMADDQASPPAPTSTSEYNAITPTTQQIDWDADWTYDTDMTIDIKDIVQELANSYNPTAIQILLKDDGCTGEIRAVIVSRDAVTPDGPTYCAKLDITYNATPNWKIVFGNS